MMSKSQTNNYKELRHWLKKKKKKKTIRCVPAQVNSSPPCKNVDSRIENQDILGVTLKNST